MTRRHQSFILSFYKRALKTGGGPHHGCPPAGLSVCLSVVLMVNIHTNTNTQEVISLTKGTKMASTSGNQPVYGNMWLQQRTPVAYLHYKVLNEQESYDALMIQYWAG